VLLRVASKGQEEDRDAAFPEPFPRCGLQSCLDYTEDAFVAEGARLCRSSCAIMFRENVSPQGRHTCFSSCSLAYWTVDEHAGESSDQASRSRPLSFSVFERCHSLSVTRRKLSLNVGRQHKRRLQFTKVARKKKFEVSCGIKPGLRCGVAWLLLQHHSTPHHGV